MEDKKDLSIGDIDNQNVDSESVDIENDIEETIDSESNEIVENASEDVVEELTEDAEPIKKVSFKETFTKVKDKTVAVLGAFGIPDVLFVRFLGVYFFLSGILVISMRKKMIYSVASWQDFVKSFNYVKGISSLIIGFLILTTIYYFLPKKFKFVDKVIGVIGIIFFSNAVMYRTNTFYMAVGVIACAVVFLAYILGKTNLKRTDKINQWIWGIPLLVVAVVVASFVIQTSVLHHEAYGTSCYDFGIFVQMFHSMKEHLTAVTTCERDELLSHFLVHASFIYYALLPVYAIFPYAETLLVSQVILAMAGVIPIFLIAKNHNFKGVTIFFVGLVYVFSTGILAPCYYDFHENCFLPTLLGWLLYAVDKKNYVLFYIMSALTCIVKEDAPLYVICIGMFFFFNEKKLCRINGLIMTVVSGVYFVIITNWLKKYGDGEMFASTRFGNLTIDPDAGFMEIVRNVLIDPGYLMSLLVEEGTLTFFMQIMIPLLFLPFATKKIHRFLLILPFAIMNLVVGSGYSYAANVGYQYTFGPETLLIYMLIINCDDLRDDAKRRLPILAAVASLVTTVSAISGNISYKENYEDFQNDYENVEECLDSIPEDASVCCNTWYLPHIANRDEVYVFDGNDIYSDPDNLSMSLVVDPDRYDFIVISPNDSFASTLTAEQFAKCGYIPYDSVDGRVLIYENVSYQLSHQ